MRELIDRQIAIDALVEASKVWDSGEPFDGGMKSGYESAVRILLSLPSQPERILGRWIEPKYESAFGYTVMTEKCNQCGKEAVQSIWHAEAGAKIELENWYCPNCGADMEEKK